MVLVTRNVNEILKMFGESIVLHQIIFENHNILYESKSSYFWANVCFNSLINYIYIYNLFIQYYLICLFI